MATTTTADVRLSALPPATGRAGLRGVLASEYTKLRSVRSTYWTIAALVIFSVGMAAVLGAAQASNLQNNPWNKAGFDATQLSVGVFVQFGQLVISVLGAMVITSEYSTGMIRTSLTAMPRRGTVFLSKLLVFTGAALVISFITSFVSFFVGQATMSGTGVSASLFHSTTIPANVNMSPPAGGPGSGGPPSYTFVGTDVITASHVLTALVGSALFVTLAAVIAFGLGAIIRHTAGAITSSIGLLFVLSIIIQLLPDHWRWDIMRFFPDAAGRVVWVTVGPDNPHLWSAWPQLGVTAIWAAVLVGVGAYLFRKRDA
jgi:ABC-type transport system involved in multi-copper enzyme maturation permease subunit